MKKSIHLQKLYQGQMNRFEKPIYLGWKIILFCLILTLVFGFLAGLGGGLLVLITRTIEIPFYKKFNLDEMLPKREITIKTREVINVMPDEQVEELIKQTRNQVVKIFLKKKNPQKILEQIYRDEESLSRGFILTSDGWIVGSKPTGLLLSDILSDFLVSTSDKRMYPVEKILVDPLLNIIFLKIKANGLEVAKLAECEDISLGNQVLVLDGADQVVVRTLGYWRIRKSGDQEIGKLEVKKEPENLIESSDRFSKFLQLSQQLEDKFIGSPVVNLKGSVVGIITNQLTIDSKRPMTDLAIPTYHFKSLIDQGLKQGHELESGSFLARPALGIDYLDLAQVRGITDKRFKDLRRGALIWGVPTKDSAGEKAGLKNADVILKINNDLVNSHYNLTELIQEYKPNDKIELTILRNGKEEKVKVELEMLKV